MEEAERQRALAATARSTAQRYVAAVMKLYQADADTDAGDWPYKLGDSDAEELRRQAPTTPPATSLAPKLANHSTPLVSLPQLMRAVSKESSLSGESNEDHTRRASAAEKLIRLLDPRSRMAAQIRRQPDPRPPPSKSPSKRSTRDRSKDDSPAPVTPPSRRVTSPSKQSPASVRRRLVMPDVPTDDGQAAPGGSTCGGASSSGSKKPPASSRSKSATLKESPVESTRHTPIKGGGGRSPATARSQSAARRRKKPKPRREHGPSCPFCAAMGVRSSSPHLCPRADDHAAEEEAAMERSLTRERKDSMRAALLRRLSTQNSELGANMSHTESSHDWKKGIKKMLRDPAMHPAAMLGTTAPQDGVHPGGDKHTLAESWEIHHIARELSMSIDDVMLVKHVFDSFDKDKSNCLSEDEFEMAICQLLQIQVTDQDKVAPERVKAISQWHWWDTDQDGSGSIDFREFVKWYSSNGFSEELLLSENERWMRKLARRHHISPTYVESIKRHFDKFDSDRSGAIDIEEFCNILHKMLKIPGNLELPETRIQFYWSEIDTDGSGKATFEEFLAWWLKYFEEAKPKSAQAKAGHVDAGEKAQASSQNSGSAPFEAFYRNVRRMGAEHMDPLVYQDEVEEEMEERAPDAAVWTSSRAPSMRSPSRHVTRIQDGRGVSKSMYA